MYVIDDYIRMVLDPSRYQAYCSALASAVEGRTVLDLGAGPGILSIVACRLGAKHVFAVERSDVIDLGPRLARDNGCEERITFIKGDSRRISLPAPVDVMVSDLRGILPVFGTHAATLIDARNRHLARGAVLIPACDRVVATLAHLPAWYEAHVGGLAHLPHGIDVDELARRNTNRVHRVRLRAESMATPVALWTEWSYDRLDHADVNGTLEWSIRQPVTTHGVALWFETDLHGGIGFDSGPGSPDSLYGQLLLPFEQPLTLDAGDKVRVSLSARLVVDDYVYTWRTEVHGKRQVTDRRQSTFLGDVFSPAQLAELGDDARPVLSTEGEMTQAALAMMRGGDATVREVALHLREAFGGAFDSLAQAMDFARRIARNFSR